jgi:hypothetical protein
MDHNEFKFKKFSFAQRTNMNVSNASEEETLEFRFQRKNATFEFLIGMP